MLDITYHLTSEPSVPEDDFCRVLRKVMMCGDLNPAYWARRRCRSRLEENSSKPRETPNKCDAHLQR